MLLADLPDETLAEVLDLILLQKHVFATKLMWDATQPRHSLRAAMQATRMFYSG